AQRERRRDSRAGRRQSLEPGAGAGHAAEPVVRVGAASCRVGGQQRRLRIRSLRQHAALRRRGRCRRSIRAGEWWTDLALLLPLQAIASTPVQFEGSTSFEASGGQVTIQVDKISNTSSDTTSGTLFLILWATSGSSPTGTGHELASVQLGELEPNEY